MQRRTIREQSGDLLHAAASCLREPEPDAKCRRVAALAASEPARGPGALAVDPGRPASPPLVLPRALPRRDLGSREGHGAFVHAIAHIEFTAINLALDAIVRFPGMPRAFYSDWLRVAAEEATHYALLATHLGTLGWRYGDFDAHGGLWDVAERSAGDVLLRMALVPRVMEARGLDVTPGMIRRLEAIGDTAGARILERILEDEIGHVAVGSHWFRHVCEARDLDPEPTFERLVNEALGAARPGAVNRPARRAAGFSDDEIDRLVRN